LRNTGVIGERADRLFALAAEALEDCAARRVGERPEKHVMSLRHNP
jgi:hypothetical protein